MRIISLTPATVPMWAVFYEEEGDYIYFEPIICLALVENGFNEVVVPIPFSRYTCDYDFTGDRWGEFPQFNKGNPPTPFLGYFTETDAAFARDYFSDKIDKYREYFNEQGEETPADLWLTVENCGARPWRLKGD